jgi:hypothetical protein
MQVFELLRKSAGLRASFSLATRRKSGQYE